MTLYHFANCLALAYTPYYLTYKYSGLAEYGAFWKVPYVTALSVAPTVTVECWDQVLIDTRQVLFVPALIDLSYTASF